MLAPSIAARFSSTTVLLLVATVGVLARGPERPAAASSGAVTVREPAFGLPHNCVTIDLELAREVAKGRLGQLIFISRVARGTLYQAVGSLLLGSLNDDIRVRKEGCTSSELYDRFSKLPRREQALLLGYLRSINDTIDAIYAGEPPEPLEVSLLRRLGLGHDLFGNATNISDQVDPYYSSCR